MSADQERAFDVRDTLPGRELGIKAWSDDEIDRFRESYRHAFPKQWHDYLTSEASNGFITNEMNDHLLDHLMAISPGFLRNSGRNKGHYRAGVVDFRFANERGLHFSMWQPDHRSQRVETFNAYIKARTSTISENGRAEWGKEQIDTFRRHLEKNEPDLWKEFWDDYNFLGMGDLGLSMRIRAQVSRIFPIPEDINYSTMLNALYEAVNDECAFVMMRPENAKIRDLLRADWEIAEERGQSFSEWRAEKLKNKDN